MMRAAAGEGNLARCELRPRLRGNLQWIRLTEHRSKFLSFRRVLILLLAIAAAVYAADFLSLRAGIPHRDELGSVTVQTFYAVKLKNGKTEYDDGGDELVKCSNSLLPQLGFTPCWYVRRHPVRQITIDSGNPNNPHLF